jgi:hypothetical protein
VAGQAELTSRQRRSLAEDGYLLVPREQWEEAGVVRMRLDPADPVYALLVRQPLLFSAADTVIGPRCRVDGRSLRVPLPGCGHQGLHPDFFPGHSTSGPWQVLAAMWCITGLTRDNGPLRVIPGSHHAAHDPADDMEFPGMGPHPDEVKLRLAVTTYLSALAKPPSA